jgi:hypothetical protein
MSKSMNKLWKESGTTLSFKEFCDRENKKKEAKNFMTFTSNPTPADLVSQELGAEGNLATPIVIAGQKTLATPNTTLGLNNSVLIFSTVLIVAAIGYYVYEKSKKK